MTDSFTDNAARSRFELTVNGETAFAEYRLEGNILYIDYVEAPEPLRGTGAASHLMEGIVDLADERGYRVSPICGYAIAWIKRHRDRAA